MTARFSPALLIGDLIILFVFTWGGMVFHEVDGSWLGHLVRIGWPFTVGYLLSAGLLGAFAQSDLGRDYFRRGVLSWLCGIGLGLMLRVIETSRLPVGAFVIVTYIFTGVLFIGWRAIYRWWSLRSKAKATTPGD